MFLHANFRPKFSLSLPADFAAYTRRWQLAQPGMLPFVDLMAEAGIAPDVDFELEVYKVTMCFEPWQHAPDMPTLSAERMFEPLWTSFSGRRRLGMLPCSPPEQACLTCDPSAEPASKPCYARSDRCLWRCAVRRGCKSTSPPRRTPCRPAAPGSTR